MTKRKWTSVTFHDINGNVIRTFNYCQTGKYLLDLVRNDMRDAAYAMVNGKKITK